MSELYRGQLHAAYRAAMAQGKEHEVQAETWRLEAEKAYVEVAKMKEEGRRREASTKRRMLPADIPAADMVTNGYKVVQDAKADFVLWMNLSNTYAALATMKYAKAEAIMAEYVSIPKPVPAGG